MATEQDQFNALLETLMSPDNDIRNQSEVGEILNSLTTHMFLYGSNLWCQTVVNGFGNGGEKAIA